MPFNLKVAAPCSGTWDDSSNTVAVEVRQLFLLLLMTQLSQKS